MSVTRKGRVVARKWFAVVTLKWRVIVSCLEPSRGGSCRKIEPPHL